MKHRFLLFQRSGIFYSEDTTTGKQISLRTRDRSDAERLLAAKNEASHAPAINLQLAQVYLQHGDPAMATRIWQDVMTQITASKRGATQVWWQCASRAKALDGIRNRKTIASHRSRREHALQARHQQTLIGSRPIIADQIHNRLQRIIARNDFREMIDTPHLSVVVNARWRLIRNP